jgi:hypothetical protein
MTGKMTLPLTLDKADIDILRILNKYCYLVVEFKFVSEDMILLDVSAFTNAADAIKREGSNNE